MSSRPSQLPQHTKLQVIEGDYCSESKLIQTQVLDGCQRLFVALPQSLSSEAMVQAGIKIAKAAHQSDTIQVMVRLSSLGIDSASSLNDTGERYSQGPLGDAHVRIEEYVIQQLQKEGESELSMVSLRPTSFFSNLSFNLQEVEKNATISTPLGYNAKVNWISCEDIARAAAKLLVVEPWNRYETVVDLTGPPENTLSANDMANALTKSYGKNISYQEVPAPSNSPDYSGLWSFLQQGGFDCNTSSLKEITGSEGRLFSEISL